MPPRHPVLTIVFAALAGAIDLMATPEVPAPYVPDAHTLHLWHLDEPGPPFKDSAQDPTPLLGLLNGARADQPAMPGFGRSVSFHHHAGGTPGTPDLKGAILLAAPKLDQGPADNVPDSFKVAGPDGAFTIEALVKLDIMPSEAKMIALGIVSMEGDGADRVFNFRIEKEGFLSFIPLSHLGVVGGALATIPITGPDAINTKDWFHVAATYDGREGASNNLKLYWTRLRPGLPAANRIGHGSLVGDLKAIGGDFAIGNEARGFPGNHEAEPFPGSIDEVRISDLARDPTDYAFVPAEFRRPSRRVVADQAPEDEGPIDLRLTGVLIDGNPTSHSDGGRPLEFPSGLDRLDFDFEVLPESIGMPARIRRQLTGLDERWHESSQGMFLLAEILDGAGNILARAEFPASGFSAGWETSLDDSKFTPRREAVFVPAGAKSIRLTLSSGAPDTTGLMAIDDVDILAPGPSGGLSSIWFNSAFDQGENMGAAGGRPAGWKRSGGNPAIARLTIETKNPALALVDADPSHDAAWFASAPVPQTLAADSTVILQWSEAYNVIDGNLHRATYINVPSGSYTFRAIAPGDDGKSVASLAVPFIIRPPFWRSPWFWPLIAASGVGFVASFIYSQGRKRARRRLRALHLQKALADDRTRIARDMHDDLGTRITLLTMNSALIGRDMEENPQRARRHLAKLNSAARNLVTAMDDLVWAVDPVNDTLNRLGIFIARTVEEMFRDAPIRCRFNIPPVLPELPLSSDFRHHIALAVRECLHNILRHAGPCEASLVLDWTPPELTITISDNGRGFDPATPESGNGLSNMVKRLEEIHGSCTITAKPGAGTTVVMRCPCPAPEPTSSHG
jgi:signal transduction histidine kinase